MNAVHTIGSAFFAAAGMFWNIFWALVLGLALSGIIMAFVPLARIVRLLGRPGVKELGLATFFGAASSSCSYAAAAMTFSIFRKGAHIIPALAFLLASTNLVIELTTVLWTMLGWQFVAAELVGGIILIGIMALLMRLFGPLKAFDERRAELNKDGPNGGPGSVEPENADPKTLDGWKVAAQAFAMESKMIWKDVVLGVLISGFLMVLVPDGFWQSLFLQKSGGAQLQPGWLQLIENAMVGPLVSVLSFVCSVGNIPLAGVLYHGGISFGGAISFIYADLIIIPLVLIYRRQYGWRLTVWIIGVLYVAMVVTGIIVDLAFYKIGWIPDRHAIGEMPQMHSFEMNYTFWLNIVFLLIAIGLGFLSKSASESGGKNVHCCHGD